MQGLAFRVRKLEVFFQKYLWLLDMHASFVLPKSQSFHFSLSLVWLQCACRRGTRDRRGARVGELEGVETEQRLAAGAWTRAALGSPGGLGCAALELANRKESRPTRR